ncbi:hypothetical protein LTS18_005357 [Coniosporium uncinatum]|uniref:Uncharacterized protein n=1 Tax=Coniosporium uncinatum TaxID=93489 RepID=A0ACC3D4U4_9PEZI|nr:hypothetical protein LTS18_005357 [Coniosporium uncinatum]
MKVWTSTSDFEYSWEEVSTANWRKYCPWNDKAPHVIAVDTLSRAVDPATGILRSERLITCKQNVPGWLSAFVGGDGETRVFECSYVDPKAKKVTMVSTNLTWAEVINVGETVVYKPSPNSPQNKTQLVQRAEITALCGGWQRIKNKIEDLSIDGFQKNAIKGREGFKQVLEMSRRAFAEQREREARL